MTGDRLDPGPASAADADAWFVRSFDELYLELYRHRDDAEAIAFAEALRARGIRGPICEIACGPGRFLRALADAGETVYGLDLSKPLLARARELLGDGLLVRGDMRALPWRGRVFGAALLLFTSFGYFRDLDDDRRVVAEAARVLQSGGSFVLDFLNQEVTLRALVAVSRREIAGARVVERRWVDPEGPYLRKTVAVEAGGAPVPGLPREERVRLYPPPDLRGLVAAQGLTVVAELGDYRGAPFDPERSARFILIARREGTG